MDIELEPRKEDYELHIKQPCAKCSKPLKNDWNYYKTHGNYCLKCLALITNKMKSSEARKAIKKLKEALEE